MFSTANKISIPAPAVQQKATGISFFRKAGDESFFGAKTNQTFFSPPVQAKLTVSQPDDPHEKEADAVADKVMRMPDTVSVAPPTASAEKLQREENKEGVQLKETSAPATVVNTRKENLPAIQAKEQTDIERSADKKEDREMSLSGEESGGYMVNRKKLSLYPADILRQSGRGPPTPSIPFEQTLASSKGGGTALPGDTRQFMESRFSADFSGVRVHTDATAGHLSRSVNAQAFAHGNDIYFNSGKFSPNSTEGKSLLAHELTHTIQQGASKTVDTQGNNSIAKQAISRKASAAMKTVPLKTSAGASCTPVASNEQKDYSTTAQSSFQQPMSSPALSSSSVGSNGTIQSKSAPANAAKIGSLSHHQVQAKEALEADEARERQQGPEASPLAIKLGSTEPNTVKNPVTNNIASTISRRPAGIQLKHVSSPQEDPAFKSVISKVKTTSDKAKKHDPVAKKVKEAQTAAKPPPNEKESKAKDKKVAEMDQQEPGTFDEAKFKAALRAKIAALQLNTLKEAENFKSNNGAAAVKGDATAQVSSETDKAAGNIENKTKEAPATGSVPGKEVGPPPAAAADVPAPAISGEQASPKPVPAEDVSLQKGSQSLDKQMADAKVTETQLAKSNEPKFTGALAEKKSAQQDAVKKPEQFRKDEKGIITTAQASAAGVSKTHLNAITGSRKQKMGGVLSKQEIAKAKDEADRAKIAKDIEQKFNVTKTDVEAILAKLDTDVAAMFDQGINEATKSFEDYVDQEVRRYKIDRYLGQIGGSLLWAKDLLMGLPDEVNDIYKRGKDRYIKAMDVVINKAAKLVVGQLNAAKKRIAQGKQEIKAYVETLPKNLQSIGAEAAKNIQSQFSELESSVNNKQNELVDSLAAKYKAGLENIDKKIADMKEANKGLVDQAIGAIKDVIDAIIAFKNMLLDVLARAAAAIQLIIDDPIGFLSNLVAGVKQGIQNFVGNIATHLKNGLMGWLFGTLAQAGITMPKSFDAQGIISLVLQVLGLTYANIRSRAVNIVGEKVVATLEKAAEIFIVIKNEGVAGLWRMIKEKVEQLKDTVIDAIKSFVTEKIIVAGVTWLISLLNPASAFIKACKMIYDVIMFFVTRGKQIMDLVNAVIDSVTAIAKGQIGVAAKAVENALAKALPVAISFLASLLGLDGISEKIKAIIAKIQAPINKAIDWVINKAVGLVKAAGKLLGIGGDKDPEKDKADKEARVHKGVVATEKALVKFKGKKVGKVLLNPILSGIKLLYRLTSLDVVPKGTSSEIVAVINPTEKKEVEVEQVENKEKVFAGIVDRAIKEASKALSEKDDKKDDKDKGDKPGDEKKADDKSTSEVVPPVKSLQQIIESITSKYVAATVPGNSNLFEVGGFTYFVDQVGHNYVYPYDAVMSKGGGPKPAGKKITMKNQIDGFDYTNWKGLLIGKMKTLLEVIGTGKPFKSGPDSEMNRIAMLIASLAAEPTRFPPAHITNLILLNDGRDHINKLSAFKTMSMTQGGSDSGKAHGDEKVKQRQVQIVKANEVLKSKMDDLYDKSRKTNDELVIEFKNLILAYIDEHRKA